ncbi:hypothetical protein J4558_27170 [Leptolyngbya sp. 15MV]|nr:hypothetical protein J4558_27170 [Leptolyngbya sp. 15MV]
MLLRLEQPGDVKEYLYSLAEDARVLVDVGLLKPPRPSATRLAAQFCCTHLHMACSLASKPVEKQPKHVRDAIGWLALVNVFFALMVWVYVGFLRPSTPPPPPPLPAVAKAGSDEKGESGGHGGGAKAKPADTSKSGDKSKSKDKSKSGGGH